MSWLSGRLLNLGKIKKTVGEYRMSRRKTELNSGISLREKSEQKIKALGYGASEASSLT
jgi:hypothetical protein